MNKEEFREELKKKRKEQSTTLINQKSEKIHHNLFSCSLYTESSSILFYVSFNSEVNTHSLIKKQLMENK